MSLNHLRGFCVKGSVQTQTMDPLPKIEGCVEKQFKRMSMENLLERGRTF